jgi:integrase
MLYSKGAKVIGPRFTLTRVTNPPNKAGKRRKVWKYRLRDDSNRQLHTTGIFDDTKNGSHAWEARQIVEKYLQEQDTISSGSSKSTLRTYAAPYFKEGSCPHVQRLRQEGKTIGDTHIKNRRRWLEMYIITDLIADIYLENLRRGDVLDFRTRLIEKTAGKMNTVDKVIGTLKTIIKEAVFRDELDKDPTLMVGNVNTPRPHGSLTQGEFLALFPPNPPGPWPDEKSYAMGLIAATSGLRWSELRALSWEQIDLKAGTIRVDRAYEKNAKKTEAPGPPKWGHLRTTYLIPKAQKILQGMKIHSNSHLVYEINGFPVSQHWWMTRIHRAFDIIGLTGKIRKERNITPHSLRTTANTMLLNKGNDAVKVQAALGWKQEVTQARYTDEDQFDLSELKKSMEKVFSKRKP